MKNPQHTTQTAIGNFTVAKNGNQVEIYEETPTGFQDKIYNPHASDFDKTIQYLKGKVNGKAK